jgi:hypothetical protein
MNHVVCIENESFVATEQEAFGRGFLFVVIVVDTTT